MAKATVTTGEEVIEKESAASATMKAILKEKRITIPEGEKIKFIEELRKATSSERVSDEPHILTYYRTGSMGFAQDLFAYSSPDVVVYPKSREEVAEILKIASKYKIPVTLVCRQAGQFGPAKHPLIGGLLIDLMGMNRIHKIDTTHGYVVVEPGVTIAQLMKEIFPKGYTLAKGSYPSAFSVLSTLGPWPGQHNFSNRMWDNVIGLEMATPDGSTLYTGTMLYGDCDLWTEVQFSFNHLKNLLVPCSGTLGVVTRAAIRIWPLLEKTALPTAGFNDFESAFRWSHAMAKSSMVDQTMVGGWLARFQMKYKGTGHLLDFYESKMKENQNEPPKEENLFTFYASAQMRGYEEEISGAVKTAKRLARQYGGTYLPPRAEESAFAYAELDNNIGGAAETLSMSVQFTGEVEEIIKMYNGLVKKFKEIGYKNWSYYTRMMNHGQTPWFRFMPSLLGVSEEDVNASLRMREEITNYVLTNYKVNIQVEPFFLNDPENPEKVLGRGEPVRRLLSAVQREFDPEGIMTPVVKKYTLT